MLVRILARLGLALLLTLALAAGTAFAQDAPTGVPRDKLTAAKAEVDRIENTLSQPGISEASLQKLRTDLDPTRATLVGLQSDVNGPRDASKARLDKLGPPPKPEDPPEAPDIAAARKRETALFTDLDGIAKDTQFQIVRVDQLSNDVMEHIREAFTRQITERSNTVLDPFFWTGVAADLPQAGWGLSIEASNAGHYFSSHVGVPACGLAFAILIAGLLIARFLRIRAARLRDRLAARPNAPRRFTASIDAVLDLLYGILGWPTAVLVAVLALQAADLLPQRTLDGFFYSLVLALVLAFAFDGMGTGILAVGRPTLRLLPLGDWAVSRIARRVRWNAVVIAFQVYVQSVGRAIFAPLSITVAATAISALLYAIVSVTLLVRLRSAPLTPQEIEAGEVTANKLDILRPINWLVVFAIVGCLVSGYIALAGFIAFFVVLLLFIVTLSYTLMTLIDAGLTDGLAVDGQRSRAIGNAIGVSSKNVAFTATLLSGVLRFIIVAASALVIATPLGFYSADMVTTIERGFFGFQLGEITISPSSILLGLVLFAGVVIITRLIQNWLRNTLLPRTTLDAGLQNSIATVIGYLGGILAIAVALSEIGLNLQNIALVAGALSVGIGFGLQSIVSNFVSGLILLAERPIRVGDIISISGDEGFVRRISVRATEVETYDRATLIIPNSQLISGVVKNWLYNNTSSRVRIVLTVGYDADPDLVRSTMRAAAEDDPRILPSPQPRVFLSKLGDAGLEFELIAVIASVETTPAVKSDLHMRILRGFREKGIRVVAQLPAAPAPVVANIDEVLAALGHFAAQESLPPETKGKA